MITMINVSYEDNEWVYGREYSAHTEKFSVVLPHFEALSPAEARCLACIKETLVNEGTYTDGATAYSIQWEVRLVGWPQGNLLADTIIRGEPKTLKSGPGPGYGRPPHAQLFHWLRKATDAVTAVWVGSPVQQFELLPGGQTMATRSTLVRLWNIETGEQFGIFPGGDDCMLLSPDGKMLATSTRDGLVRLWDPESGQQLQTLAEENTGDYRSCALAFSPDGQLLASADTDGSTRVWDLATNQALFALPGQDRSVCELTFSPRGAVLAVETCPGESGSILTLWDMGTGNEVAGFSDTYFISFSPDGKYLAMGTEEAVRILTPQTGQEIHTLKQTGAPYFSPDGQTLAVRSTVSVDLLDIDDWDVRLSLEESGWPWAFSPDGSILALVQKDTIALWDAQNDEKLTTLKGHRGRIRTLRFSSDGKTLISASWDGTVRLWDVASMR